MNLASKWFSAALIVSLSFSVSGWAQSRPFPSQDLSDIYLRLLPQIETIPIIDMHAHPGYWDGQRRRCHGRDRYRPRSITHSRHESGMAEAAKALFGYPYSDFSPEHAALAR